MVGIEIAGPRQLAKGLVVFYAEGRLMFMNAAASRMLDWSEYELLGKSVHAAIHDQHADVSLFGRPQPLESG